MAGFRVGTSRVGGEDRVGDPSADAASPTVSGSGYGALGYDEAAYGERDAGLAGRSAGAGGGSGRLTVAHRLVGVSRGIGSGSGRLTGDHDLRGVSLGVGAGSAAITVAHRLTGIARGIGAAVAYFVVMLPEVRPARPGEMPGAINLVRNPSAEVDLADWIAQGAATRARTADVAWDGAWSVAVACPGAAAGEGIAVRTVRGLAFAGGRVLWGHVRLAGTATGVVAFLRARYADGGAEDGDATAPFAVDHPGDGRDWPHIVAPAVALDPARVLIAAELVVVTATAAPATFLADGAQVEEDRGQGPTAFVVGTYGVPAGRWHGAPHRSVSVRDPIALTVGGVGTGGDHLIEPFLWRVDETNAYLEDLTPYVLSALLSVDPERDVCREMSCEMTIDGWRKLRRFRDWLAPGLVVTYPDGTRRGAVGPAGQLGRFLVVAGDRTRTEAGGDAVTVKAYGPEWLLKKQNFGAPYQVRANTNAIRAAREVVGSGGFGDITRNQVARFVIPQNLVDRLRHGRSWPRLDDKLTIVNDLLRAGGYLPLWGDKAGFPRSMDRADRRYGAMQPVRTWAALVPPGLAGDPRVALAATLPSEVVGAVTTTTDTDRLDNHILIATADPRGPRSRTEWRIDHPANPIATTRTKRRRTRTVPWPYLAGIATAAELARSLADEVSTRVDRVTLTVLPDPTFDPTHAVVTLAIWDLTGEPVAVGRYRILTCAYGFSASDAVMSLELGLVYPIDQLDGLAIDAALAEEEVV